MAPEVVVIWMNGAPWTGSRGHIATVYSTSDSWDGIRHRLRNVLDNNTWLACGRLRCSFRESAVLTTDIEPPTLSSWDCMLHSSYHTATWRPWLVLVPVPVPPWTYMAGKSAFRNWKRYSGYPQYACLTISSPPGSMSRYLRVELDQWSTPAVPHLPQDLLLGNKDESPQSSPFIRVYSCGMSQEWIRNMVSYFSVFYVRKSPALWCQK